MSRISENLEALALVGCALSALSALPACNNSGTEMDFERMVNQAKYKYYREADFFPDHRSMRTPPEGTMPTDGVLAAPRVVSGAEADGAFVAKIPVRVDRKALEVGRDRFNVYCAPCHGAAGDAVSQVAHRMELRKPPSLVTGAVVDYPDGRIYQAISLGFGLMPSYGQELSVADRWSVVAYVRALGVQRGGVAVDSLPEAIRKRAIEGLQ
jgi:mono/diheme cytochrome c family protein